MSPGRRLPLRTGASPFPSFASGEIALGGRDRPRKNLPGCPGRFIEVTCCCSRSVSHVLVVELAFQTLVRAFERPLPTRVIRVARQGPVELDRRCNALQVVTEGDRLIELAERPQRADRQNSLL